MLLFGKTIKLSEEEFQEIKKAARALHFEKPISRITLGGEFVLLQTTNSHFYLKAFGWDLLLHFVTSLFGLGLFLASYISVSH